MAKHKILSAIDVGTSKVTALMAQIRDEDDSRIHVIGVASTASKGIRKGQIVNIDEAVSAVTEAVEAAERMAGYNLARAWVSVGGAHISSLNSHGVVAVSQPHGEIQPDDVRRVLEAAQAVSLPGSSEVIHVIPRNFSVDNQEGVRDPVGMTGVRLEVDTHIVTGSATTVKNLTKCISEVGCDISGLVYSGLASGEATLTDTEKELGVILVDIGGGTTDLAIYTDGALTYSSVLPIGAKNVTNDLAIGLRVSLESAEKIKLHLSRLKPDSDDLNLDSLHLSEEIKSVSYKTLVEGIIRPRLNEIFQLVTAEIKKSTLAGLTPAGVVLTGGGAQTVGIADSAKRVLSMPVRIGIPSGISGLIDDIETPAFAAPVGLLRYAASRADTTASGKSSHMTFASMFNNLPGAGVVTKISGFIKSLLP